MASENMQKYLDQDGVATLWSQVVEKIDEKNAPIQELSEGNASNIETMKGQIKALQDGAYDDTEVRRLISNNLAKINAHNEVTDTLQADANTTGSVRNIATAIAAAEIAKVVAGADKDFDTLKEIADWILNDTTGAADMANDIAALQNLVGNTAVATQITNALKTNGVDKYALATELTSLANRVQTLEKSGFMNATSVDSAIDSKINALKLANTYEAKGAANTALANAKAYSDANLAVAKTYADTNKVDINAPILKGITSFRDTYNGTVAFMEPIIDQNDDGTINSRMGILYLGLPVPPTEEEKAQMSENEREEISHMYGDATVGAMGGIVLMQPTGAFNVLYPSFSNEFVLNFLPSVDGELITDEWLEVNSDYLANLVINKLPTYTGGDY